MNKKAVGIALIVTFLIIFIGVSAATSSGWVISVRFYFGLLPFEESKSASVAMMDEPRDTLLVRPISYGYQMRFIDLITLALKGEEPEVAHEWKHIETPSLSRTVPRYSMGWVNPTKIRVFETECDVSYLEMWVRDEALYLNIRYQGEGYLDERLFLIEDPDLAVEAYDLMVEAWYES